MKNKTTLLFNLVAIFSVSFGTQAEEAIAPPMVAIPAGEFEMGTSHGDPASQPLHSVTVDGFQISKYPITVAEFAAFAQATGYSAEATCNDFFDKEGLRGPTHKGSGTWQQHRFNSSEYQPVTCINLATAKQYAAWLSEKKGVNYRLPTEQEWEYAARANTHTRFFWGNDPYDNQACNYGNVADYTGEYTNNKLYGYSNIGFIGHSLCDDGEAYHSIVGMYRPNPFGLYDIAGNVLELVDSCYQATGYRVQSEQESTDECEFTGVRGSSWHYPARAHTHRGRTKREGWNVSADIGFRLVSDESTTYKDDSTIAFEKALLQAQKARNASRPVLLSTPTNVTAKEIAEGNYRVEWAATNDHRITHYDIYKSKTPYARFLGGFYKARYLKHTSVPSSQTSITVPFGEIPSSYLVVAVSDQDESLPSDPIMIGRSSERVSLPGKINMEEAVLIENVSLHPSRKTEGNYFFFKTNTTTEQVLVKVVYEVDVAETGRYRLNFNGQSFQTGSFFKLWSGNRLLLDVQYDPEIDDRTSNRFEIYLEKGKQEIELNVSREGFDRWMLDWIELSRV